MQGSVFSADHGFLFKMSSFCYEDGDHGNLSSSRRPPVAQWGLPLLGYITHPCCGSRLVLNLEEKKNTYGSPPP